MREEGSRVRYHYWKQAKKALFRVETTFDRKYSTEIHFSSCIFHERISPISLVLSSNAEAPTWSVLHWDGELVAWWKLWPHPYCRYSKHFCLIQKMIWPSLVPASCTRQYKSCKSRAPSLVLLKSGLDFIFSLKHPCRRHLLSLRKQRSHWEELALGLMEGWGMERLHLLQRFSLLLSSSWDTTN